MHHVANKFNDTILTTLDISWESHEVHGLSNHQQLGKPFNSVFSFNSESIKAHLTATFYGDSTDDLWKTILCIDNTMRK